MGYYLLCNNGYKQYRGFTATVPYLDLYEAHRSAKLEFVLDSGTYKINRWEMNLEAMNGK